MSDPNEDLLSAFDGHEVESVRAALDAGADPRSPIRGKTPIYWLLGEYTRSDRLADCLRLLLEAGAKADIRLAGITWGKGYPWETAIFDVTPISYAQMGLLPQMHRNEHEIYSNIAVLLKAAGRSVPPLGNVPNKYLQPKARS